MKKITVKRTLAGIAALALLTVNVWQPCLSSGSGTFIKSVTAKAANIEGSGQCGDNLFWEIDDEGVLTIFGTGDMYNYGSFGFEGYPEIDSPFASLNIRKLYIGEGVTSIGFGAFSCCSGIEFVQIPSSVTNIDAYSFEGCTGLKDIDLSSGVQVIGEGAFYECTNLEKVTSTSIIGPIYSKAFAECKNLKKVEAIVVRYVDEDVFEGCTSYELTDKLASNKCGDDLTWELDNEGTLTISGTGDMWNFCSCEMVSNEDYLKFSPYFNESPFMYLGSQVKNIVISEGVTSIGSNAFLCCSECKSIVIPSTVHSVGCWAFGFRSSFEELRIHSSFIEFSETEDYKQFDFVDSAKVYASPDSIFTTDDAPDSNAEEFVSRYSNLSFETLEVPSSDISDRPSRLNCTIDDDGTMTITGTGSIENHDFIADWYKIKKIIIGEGITSIDDSAFSDYSYLESVELPSTLKLIGLNAFQNCSSLENIEFPSSLESIGINAFRNCSKLRSVQFPESISSIGDHAFEGCSVLEAEFPYFAKLSNYFKGTEYHASIGYNAFDGIKKLKGQCGDNVFWELDNDGTLTISGTGDIWDREFNFEGYPESTFFSFLDVKNVIIEDGITSIGAAAFCNCSELESVDIPSSVTSIYAFAFEDCSKLEYIKLPPNVNEIYSNTFANCTSLKCADLSSGVHKIAAYAFYNCTGLEEIKSNSIITLIYNNAFDSCTSLKKVEGVCFYHIWEDAFKDCPEPEDRLASHKCGDNLTWEIDDEGTLTISGTGDMWNYCGTFMSSDEYNAYSKYLNESPFMLADKQTPVKKIVVSEGVTSIGNNAFAGCVNCESIEIPSTVTSIGYSAIYVTPALKDVTILSKNVKFYPDEEKMLFAFANDAAVYAYPDAVFSYDESNTSAEEFISNYENINFRPLGGTVEAPKYAPAKQLAEWAVNDFTQKTGITPVKYEFKENADNSLTVTMCDDDENVLETYNVDMETAVGTDSKNDEVDLPQTGDTSPLKAAAAASAAAMLGLGAAFIVCSKKKVSDKK